MTKSTIRKQHTVTGFAFDSDIRGLFKPELSKEVLGKKLRFLAPSIVQKALMMRFLILAFQDMVSTVQERESMSFESLYSKCLSKLGELQVKPTTPQEEEKHALIMGRMFTNPDANEYLLKAIAQSFPDLTEPEKLTDEAFINTATVLIQAMQH